MNFTSSLAAAAVTSTLIGAAQAGVLCAESVTSVIVHTNGNIYFQTDKTCGSNWCQLNLASGNVSVNKNAYAMLLTAQTTGKPLNIQWDSVSDCTQQNPVYSSPAYIVLPR